jgi:hypothetical protein
MVTVVVINKTFGDLTSQVALQNLSPSGSAKAYRYSAANLSSIMALPDQAVTPPAAGGTTSIVSGTFPAQSITLFIVPKM